MGWWRWALVSPDGVVPSRMVGVSASVNLLLHHKVQKFASGTSSPGWSRKKGRKMVVVVYHFSKNQLPIAAWIIWLKHLYTAATLGVWMVAQRHFLFVS